ncbi:MULTISPECIES: S26 family signal peptidase [Methylocystis]|uniref:S26 family signal peptidase n=1 Tax=Methylocystis rosea TaxID=173366 RepID=A0A3G8M8Q8_9HYPH|nr:MULTISPECIES: S26 family signal peptidase [Methylocystis]AZG78399.1 S26 family signal peptidase [Methylocystis rosea]CCJ07300.1 Peptidase S26, conserved region [Methylocystis sp. SC2]
MKIFPLMFLSCGALASTSFVHREPLVVWNASASVPIGLYAVQPIGDLAVTDLVVARPPAPLADWLTERHYLPKGAPLIKRVAALPGQKICRDGLAVSVDGIVMTQAREQDHADRPLPVWSGCFVLLPGEAFLLNWNEAASLDGRYFGAFPIEGVVGRAAPLWTREDD